MKNCFAILLWAILFVNSWAGAALGADDGFRVRLLHPLDTPTLPNVGAWKVASPRAFVADGVEPQFGAAAVRITGNAEIAGGKIDATLYGGELEDCHRVEVAVHLSPESNTARLGLQYTDAKGEMLMQVVPADWQGWKNLSFDPTAPEIVQAYAQKDHDGKVDLPLKSVHFVAFSANPGTMAVVVDRLTARVPFDDARTDYALQRLGSDNAEPGKPLALRFAVENPRRTPLELAVDYRVQVNPTLIEPKVPEPVIGFDHAVGAKTTVSVDGAERGDAFFCDDSEFTSFDSGWGAGVQEAVATIELPQSRNLTAMRWLAGDANWIRKVDISVSADGTDYRPVEACQGFDMKGKWGLNRFPWPKTPVAARYIRFRFHNDGEKVNVYRLPVSVMVYDGIENDTLEIPETGKVIARGTATASVPAGDIAEVVVSDAAQMMPGCYLLDLVVKEGGKSVASVSNLLVPPADEVPADRARRFGINSSTIGLGADMRHCGFGWVRFENAKWQMYCTAPDKFAFDGSVGPWHVPLDSIFAEYQKLGFHVLPYVFQTPRWASTAPADTKKNVAGYPPKNPADYGEAIYQLVARFGTKNPDPATVLTPDKETGKNLINAVELWNEPNLNAPSWGPFVGTFAEYYDVMRAGVEGARRADPDLTVSAAGWAGIGLDVVGTLAEHRYPDGKTPLDLVDVINVHFYSGREDPETCGYDPNASENSGSTYPEKVADLVEWRDRNKAEAEIWITETGNDVGGPIGLTERYQAAKVPRCLMIALAGGIEKVMIYREAGSTPARHAGAGLLRNDFSRRPVWYTVATLIRQLQGFDVRALRLPVEDANVWMYYWEQDGRRLVAAWSIEGTPTLGVDFGKAQLTDAFGSSRAVDGTRALTLSDMPIYLSLQGTSQELDKLVAAAKSAAEAKAEQRRRLAAMQVTALDFGTTEYVGVLQGFGLPRRFTAVTKDMVWDGARGFGFEKEAGGPDNRHWIKSPLERDGCKVHKGNPFRLKLPAGKHRLQICATQNNGMMMPVTVKAAAGEQQPDVPEGKEIRPTECVVEGGDEPVEIVFGTHGLLLWLTAAPVNE